MPSDFHLQFPFTLFIASDPAILVLAIHLDCDPDLALLGDRDMANVDDLAVHMDLEVVPDPFFRNALDMAAVDLDIDMGLDFAIPGDLDLAILHDLDLLLYVNLLHLFETPLPGAGDYILLVAADASLYTDLDLQDTALDVDLVETPLLGAIDERPLVVAGDVPLHIDFDVHRTLHTDSDKVPLLAALDALDPVFLGAMDKMMFLLGTLDYIGLLGAIDYVMDMIDQMLPLGTLDRMFPPAIDDVLLHVDLDLPLLLVLD